MAHFYQFYTVINFTQYFPIFSASNIPVDDELEAATRFNGSEEDEEAMESPPNNSTPTDRIASAEIWCKVDQKLSSKTAALPDLAL